MASQKQKLAFYGLGAMGGGMAAHLVKKGYHVTGYDLYQPLAEKFAAAGGHTSPSPSKAAQGSQVVIIMVATMYQANALLFSTDDPAVKGLERDAILILCSTCPITYPPQLRKLLDDAGRTDVQLLDCPVSGGTIRAAAGTLSIFASGPSPTLDAANDVLIAMSANLYRIEGGISGGQKVKAIHQLMAATNIISASEAMGLSATAGLPSSAVYEHVRASSGASFMFDNRVPHMLENDWTPLSALAIIWKDAGIVVDAARELRHPVPLCGAAEQLYSTGNARGLLKDDDAKLVTLYLPSDRADAVSKLKDAPSSAAAASEHGISAETVNDLLAGIHLAASVEAMSLCKALGMDRRVMYGIVSKAAGWARVFEAHVSDMLDADQWTLAACPAAEEIGRKLEVAVDACGKVGFPAMMGSVALQLFRFAGLQASR